ncbi:hypothetical protein Tco_0444290, partial [Tanacetum coccineum]
MDGRGTGSCVELFSVPSGFSVSPSVKLLVAGRGRVGKGGSHVLIHDLVVMAKVGALGLGVLLFVDCYENLEVLFTQSFTVLDKHVSYPFCEKFLVEQEVGELVFKLTSNSPFRATFSFFLSFVV